MLKLLLVTGQIRAHAAQKELPYPGASHGLGCAMDVMLEGKKYIGRSAGSNIKISILPSHASLVIHIFSLRWPLLNTEKTRP